VTTFFQAAEFETPEEFLTWFQDTAAGILGSSDLETHVLRDTDEDDVIYAFAPGSSVCLYAEFEDGQAALFALPKRILIWLIPRLIDSFARMVEP